jgi:signal transduction histidine kinase
MNMFAQELLHTACVLPTSFAGDYLSADLLRIEKRVRFAVFMSLLHSLSQIFFGYLATRGIENAPHFNAMAQVLIYLLPPLIISRVPIVQRILAVSACFLAEMFASIPAEAVFVAMGGEIRKTVAISASSPLGYAAMFTVSFVLTVLIMLLVRLIWNRVLNRAPSRVLKLHLLFPISQMMAIVPMIHFASAEEFVPMRYIWILVVMIFFVAADVLLMRSIRSASEKAVAEERALWYEQLLKEQEQHYETLMADMEDAAKIRHDIRNQLQTVYALLQSGSHEQAKSQLDDIGALVNQAPSYCANPVINALLAVKAGQCESAGVALDCACDVPARLPIDGVELCSLFSNVLDNALRAARDSGQETPKVELRSGVQGNVFTLRCRNSCPVQPEDTPRPGHGLGLEILRDLAARHDGEVQTDRADGIFTATVQLLLQDKSGL